MTEDDATRELLGRAAPPVDAPALWGGIESAIHRDRRRRRTVRAAALVVAAAVPITIGAWVAVRTVGGPGEGERVEVLAPPNPGSSTSTAVTTSPTPPPPSDPPEASLPASLITSDTVEAGAPSPCAGAGSAVRTATGMKLLDATAVEQLAEEFFTDLRRPADDVAWRRADGAAPGYHGALDDDGRRITDAAAATFFGELRRDPQVVAAGVIELRAADAGWTATIELCELTGFATGRVLGDPAASWDAAVAERQVRLGSGLDTIDAVQVRRSTYGAVQAARTTVADTLLPLLPGGEAAAPDPVWIAVVSGSDPDGRPAHEVVVVDDADKTVATSARSDTVPPWFTTLP